MANTKEVLVPNIGGATDVEVIEVLVSAGDQINKESSLITLESDKASMEIPAPFQGEVEKINVKVGDKVSEGSLILTLKVAGGAPDQKKVSEKELNEPKAEPKAEKESSEKISKQAEPKKSIEEKPTVEPFLIEPKGSTADVHAGPAVRRLAREFGIDLNQISGSGPKNRVIKEDLQKFVKEELKKPKGTGLGISPLPRIDFAKFGEIEKTALNKIKKLTGVHVHRSWVTVPHVTQFGEADITEMESFRKAQKERADKEGVKLTPLVFIMKAVVNGLKHFPYFNASLDSDGDHLILKKYFHIGIAVDTPNGLVVPVIRDVDKKGMFELARELGEISQKAREKGLTPAEMSGSCFTISSLGGIGGTAFTPIVNAPDVAILGVSKASIKPVYENKEFVPRLMLPLSLSYDHRVIDGAEGARFLVYVAGLLSDIRSLLL